MTKIGICKFCNQETELIGKSHIIPNFMYDGLFDKTRKMFLINMQDFGKKPRVAQSGIFEKHIFCLNCETLFSKYERYASHFFKGTKNSSLSFEKRKSHDGLRSIYISGIDYTKLKLCFLSILWKAHISKNGFFKRVVLNSQNESEIKQMLLEGNAKADNEFKVSFLGLQSENNELVRLLIDPSIETIGKGNVALFLISGYCYFIELKPVSNFKIFDAVYLKESGEIEVPLLNGKMAIRILTAFGVAPSIAKNYILLK